MEMEGVIKFYKHLENAMGMVCEFKKKRTGTFGNITNSNLDATISQRIKT
jgi:hypothetical protein